MTWQAEQFESSHEGSTGAVMADGSEPKPVYFDIGSGGGSGQWSSDWWIYDGTLGAPRADFLRAQCSCGWRGTRRSPIDWEHIEDLRDCDTSDHYDDWAEHIDQVQARSVPLPAELEGLLERVEDQLSSLADDAPLAALKAVAQLERATKRISHTAAQTVRLDETPWETVAQALGLTEQEARSRLTSYSLRR